jgi:hypothetical protein
MVLGVISAKAYQPIRALQQLAGANCAPVLVFL